MGQQGGANRNSPTEGLQPYQWFIDAPKMLEFCRAATMEFKTSVDEIIKIRSTV